MNKLLITGAFGFIGTNLSKALKDEHTLWALDVTEYPSEAYSHFFSWKELDTIPWDEINTIIHLAGKAHDTKNSNNAHVYFEVNTELTKRIFDKFLASNAERFFFFSSIKTVADESYKGILTENITPHPIGPYGESKLKAEEYIQFYVTKYLVNSEMNKKAYILRPCMIHGPANKGNLNLLYNIVSKGIPWPLGAFENKRSFLSIDNLSYVIKLFFLKNPESGIYHLADDEPVSTNELIKLIAQSKGDNERIWRCNKNLITLIARIGDVCKLPLNTDRLHKLTGTYVVSNQKVKRALGIERLPVSSVDGLKRTFDSLICRWSCKKKCSNGI